LFTRSRHNNIDCIYISQNYYHLPRHTIRSNSNFLILFNLDPVDTDHLYRDSGASVDFKDINKFRHLCERAWNKKYGYIVIDKFKTDLEQKYRFQLELENQHPVQINGYILHKVIDKKSRPMKDFIYCNLIMLCLIHANNINIKINLKKNTKIKIYIKKKKKN